MTKQEVIELIHYLFFKVEENEIGNLKLESYEEEGDWQIVACPVVTRIGKMPNSIVTMSILRGNLR